MKKAVRILITVVFFIPAMFILPIAALGYWVESKDATYPEALNIIYAIFFNRELYE